MLASSTLLKNVLRPRDLICCWESYLLVLQKIPIFRKLYHLFWNTYICEWWLPTLGCVRKEWNHVDIGKWFPRGFCAHSSPPASSIGMGDKVSAPPGSQYAYHTVGRVTSALRLCQMIVHRTKLLLSGRVCQYLRGMLEWSLFGPHSEDEWDGVAHLGDPQQPGTSSPAARVLWVFRARHLSSVLDPNCLLDRGSCHFSPSPSTTEGSSGAKEAFGRATDKLDSLVISHSLL